MPSDQETLRQPMGSPVTRAAPEAARVLLVHPPALRRSFRVGRDELVLGRSPGAGGQEIDHVTVSRRHASVRWDTSEHVISDLGSRNGSRLCGASLDGQPRALSDGDVIRIGDVLLVYERSSAVEALDPAEVSREALFGEAAAMVQLRASVAAAGRDPSPVLLVGETGTGKEHVAREIHRLSGRRGPWMGINCAALSPELVESQLFGHQRGAFTGADADQPGLFRAAQGGSILLDEVGELPLPLQAKLLRVLQEREVLPVGATRALPIDVRVIAATLRDLRALTENGEFRLDLYARLSPWEIQVPPLGRRRADVLAWLERFDRLWHEQRGRPPRGAVQDANAAERLLLHPWPDNLRGLERLVHQASGESSSYDAPAVSSVGPATIPEASPPSRTRRDRPTREELEQALAEHGSVRATAKALGRERRLIYRWMALYGIRDKV